MHHKPFRLLLVDDHPVVLFGLRLLFAQNRHFTIVAEARSSTTARDAMEREMADFAVVDLVMGERDGASLVEDLLAIHASTQILVYSSLDDLETLRAVLRAGARGYLPKTEGLEAVASAMDRIATGEIVVGSTLQARFLGAMAEDERNADALSRRERQVLDRMGRGHGLQTIARDLSLSVKTVGTYRERLKTKLGLDSLRTLERYAADASLTARQAR